MIIFISVKYATNQPPCVPGSRQATTLTAAQAYALRWDLSPFPATRQMPIIPREPIIEPLEHRSNIERNIFTPKFSSLKDCRNSKVTPLTDQRSWTVDDPRTPGSKEERLTKMEKLPIPISTSMTSMTSLTCTKTTNNASSSLYANQLQTVRPKSTPGQIEKSSAAVQQPPATPCQS